MCLASGKGDRWWHIVVRAHGEQMICVELEWRGERQKSVWGDSEI